MATQRPVFRSKTQLLLRETWRRAWRAGQLEITFQTESHAHKARMDLYKAVQMEKQGRGPDTELIEASQSLEIVLGSSRNVLLMRPRGQNAIYAALQDATGLELKDMVDPELAGDAGASWEKLKPQLATQHQANPFFKR
jgi:hypothetical protein